MFDVADRAMARALEGPAEEAIPALRALTESEGEGADQERVAAALALASHRLGVAGPLPSSWKRALHAQVARNFLLDEAAQQVARILGEATIPWLPLKGFDLATRIYAEREERRTSDLDILVPAERWTRARELLRAAGFRALSDAAETEHYLQHEGYAWQAWSPHGILLELHFRLWGTAPASLAPALLARAEPDPRHLGASGLRARLEDAYLVAAFHFWLDPPPRPWGPLRDLCRILAADPSLPPRIASAARSHQLQLPTALATQLVAELFARPDAAALAGELRQDLRIWERTLPARPDLSLYRLALARLFSRRPSRLGSRSLLRVVWPHAAVIAAATPASWPWFWRRLWYVCRKSGPPPNRARQE